MNLLTNGLNNILQKAGVSFMLMLLVGFSGTLMAQQDYYYYYGTQKQYVELNNEFLYIAVSEDMNSLDDLQTTLGTGAEVMNFDADRTSSSLKSVAGVPTYPRQNWAIARLRSPMSATDYLAYLSELKTKDLVSNVAPFFKHADDPKVGLSQYFYVKLNKESDIETLKKQSKKFGAAIVGQNRYMPLWYTLTPLSSSNKNAMEMANSFFESGYFAYAEPSLMVGDFGLSGNDPLFVNQWGLENTGQYGGTVGVDVNACAAWDVTQGSRDIVVAVLDQGIELNHPDLAGNIFPVSFDCFTNTSPSTVYGSHGTACAGIVAAVRNNNTGVSGVAPNVRLMDVSHTLTFTPNVRQELANGLNWAWMNGADVISNSWGSNALSSVLIDNAITNALNNGRGGLGTIVVFAAGNTNGSVIYPASSNPNIISVAAMSPCAQRKSPTSCDGENFWGSSFGAQIDVMAPGVLISTTDRQGAAGYSPNDYTNSFNGTSSACPNVAGVSALVLSLNPCIPRAQVNNIIEQTAQKVGTYAYAATPGRPNGGWHQEVGYGLVDAQAAMLAAQAALPSGNNYDLMIRDQVTDLGLEPNPSTAPFWISPDMWVRNNLDGGTTHQNPEFKLFSPNGLYVNITNIGTQTSPCANLAVYFSKASTGLQWPTKWNNFMIGSTVYGDLINTIAIPPIAAGATYTAEIPWYPPNPASYPTDIHHFCLLARIISPSDQMYFEQTNVNIFPNVKNNNNIAWKNVSVYDAVAGNFADNDWVSVFIRGVEAGESKIDLRFWDKGFEGDVTEAFFDMGGIVWMQTDEKLTDRMLSANLDGVEQLADNLFYFKTADASINSLVVNAADNLAATFKFELPEGTAGDDLILDFIQYIAGTNRMEGGERFIIQLNNVNINSKPDQVLITEDPQSFVYPNPAGDEVFVDFMVKADQTVVAISIIDVSGRLVKQAMVNTKYASGTYTENVDISTLNPGVYFVQLQVGDEIQTEKIVKDF